jgi:CubicO group peptidase (beta-lactamase class C family)
VRVHLTPSVLLGDTPDKEFSVQGRKAVANPLDQVASWPATAAAGVASAAGLVESAGPAGRPFAWASVTKLLVALAALDAVQRGLLDLDEPAGPPGSTIRHLLSHASGLGPDGDVILSSPGRRRIYSNRGIEIVADIIAARAGRPFERLLADQICLPLGMAGTRLEGSPAWGAVGPLSDLMNLAVELARPSLVDDDLMAEATRTAFPGLSGVLPGFGRQPQCDWGLGFEIRDGKDPHWTGSKNSPRTFGHFGRSGSFLWVDPDAGIACAALADRDFGDWAKQAWPRLSDDVLASCAGKDLSGRTGHGPSHQPRSCPSWVGA